METGDYLATVLVQRVTVNAPETGYNPSERTTKKKLYYVNVGSERPSIVQLGKGGPLYGLQHHLDGEMSMSSIPPKRPVLYDILEVIDGDLSNIGKVAKVKYISNSLRKLASEITPTWIRVNDKYERSIILLALKELKIKDYQYVRRGAFDSREDAHYMVYDINDNQLQQLAETAHRIAEEKCGFEYYMDAYSD